VRVASLARDEAHTVEDGGGADGVAGLAEQAQGLLEVRHRPVEVGLGLDPKVDVRPARPTAVADLPEQRQRRLKAFPRLGPAALGPRGEPEHIERAGHLRPVPDRPRLRQRLLTKGGSTHVVSLPPGQGASHAQGPGADGSRRALAARQPPL
jgi:hypothetical protein